MKFILSLFLSLAFIGSQAQQMTTNYTPIGTGSDDLMRPDAGFNEWTGGQFVVPMPSATGTNPTPLARYWRFTWLDFQAAGSASNAYNFTVFDSKIQESINKGQKFSFGIMQQCGGCDANQQSNVGGNKMLYPNYLHAQMQGEAIKDFTSGGEWFPYYNSPSYLTAWKNLNVALNAHIMSGSFNGRAYKDVIGQIDIRGYGDYGEWTNNVFTNGNITVGTGDSIISAVVHSFNTFQCVYMMATLDGGQLTSNTNVPPGVGYYALTTRNAYGPLGWRRDSWGQTDGYLSSWSDNNNTTFNGIRFKDTLMVRYRQAPIVGEPQDGGSAGNFPALPGQMPQYGVTSVGNGNFNNGHNATIDNNFRAASKVAGYRIVVTSSSMTTTPTPGATYIVTLNWQNINGIPPYDNWKCVYEWRNASNTVLQRDTGTFGLRGFFSTTVVPKTEVFTLRTVPAGTGYTLFLKVVDPTGYMHPMPLFITGVQADGAYPLRTGITVAASGPVANAGPNQNISGTTATLTSAGSVGAVTQIWTQSSGPNTAGITTPTGVTTGLTGLITGTYVFQVAINGASSGQQVSTVTVVVNAPSVHADAGNNQTITLPLNTVALTGSASTNATSYKWTQQSGPNTATIGNSTAAVANASGLIQGVYVFQLSINAGASTATTTVTVLQAPAGVANAGGDQTIPVTTPSVTLSGSLSTGTITSYLWKEVSGPTNATIATPNAVSTVVGPFGPGVYKFSLTVNGTSVDTVQLTVNGVNPPSQPPAGQNVFTSQVPSGGTLSDGQAITLGMKFQSKVKGYVTGGRFYKTNGNTGTHIILLYSRTGTELARATVLNETGTGWQWASFATPVPIDSNTTYVISYFSPNDFYVTTNEYFTTSVSNPPLIGLANGVDGNNGIYHYGGTAAFPTSYFNNHKPNYWVDVYFTPSNPGTIGTNATHRIYFQEKDQ